MSNTLRRKMFKLGGSANTHGVGITSGLKMNKGGRVGFQQGNVVNPNLRPPFFNFALPGSPNFDPRFAPLEEQLRPLRGQANLGFSQMKLGAADDPRTGGGILTALLGQQGEPAPQPGTAEYAEAMRRAFETGSQLDPDTSYLSLTEVPGAKTDDPDTAADETQSTFNIGIKKGSELIQEQKEERGEVPQTLEEQTAIAKEKRDAVEAITTAEKQADVQDIQEIEGDDASSLEEDPDSFEEDVRERARVLQSLFETDSKSDILAQALIQGGAQLLEGGGAESYQKAAKAVGDVFTESAKTRRAVKNLATSQAIKDVTAERAADALSESQKELYGMKLLAEAAKGTTLTKKEEASLYTDLLELGGESYADDYMAIYKSGFDTKRLPILPGAKPGQELEKIDETKLIPGEVYIYNGRYFGTNSQGTFQPFTTLIDAEQYSKS